MPRLLRISYPAVLLLLACGCASGSYYIEPDGDAPADLFLSSEVFDPDGGPRNVVIQSTHDWSTLLSNYPTVDRDFARARFDRVDISRYMVVGVILGSRWGGSVSVHIDSLRSVAQHLVVYATEYHPSRQTGEWTNPAHFVVIPRTNMPVEFADVNVEVEASE
ncbi:MAG: hypothetical protein WD021_02660 [Rhodothermales bacterium]